MNAIIFAAGMGTRMFPLSKKTPKPLIRINEKPIIENTIELLNENKIKNIFIVVGYLREKFNYLEKKYKNVKLIDNEDYAKSNNISSLFYSKEHWTDVLYVEGDVYIFDKKEFSKIISICKKSKDSLCFGFETKEDIDEWKFNYDNDLKILDHSTPAKRGDYLWTGILYINEFAGKEIVEKIDNFYKNKNNKNKYFEQFFWTLKNKFTLKKLHKKISYELDNFSELLELEPNYGFEKKLLMTPGPVNTPEQLMVKISSGIVHHRSNLAEYYIKECVESLKKVFDTKEGEIILLTSSGTGAMESSVANIIEEGDKVALINTGDFSNRFKDILELYKAKIIMVESSNEKQMYKELESLKNKVKAIYLLHHETSNGILLDIKKIGKIFSKSKTLVIVDSISSLLIEEFHFDKWSIDIALGSSPKAFALPPGLSYVCLSQKALKTIERTDIKSFYFDYKKYLNYYKNYSQTPFTPAISLIISTIESIKMFLKKNNYREMNEYIYNELQKLGFKKEISNQKQSLASVCLLCPEGIDASELRDFVAEEENIYFELGRAELRSKMIRIGIIGNVEMNDCKRLIKSIKKFIK